MVRALLIIAFLAAWFLPLIIAALYKLPHQGSIAVLSLLLGWTGVGWLAALVIVVGGAIRATRPPLAGQEATPAPAYVPAQAGASAPAQERAQSAERSQLPRRAPSGEQIEPMGRAQPPERPAPRWPDNPR
jgi:hypothetical protein